MRTRNRAPQEKMPDEELSRRILFYGHLANLCAYGCIAGAVLGVLAGILLQSFSANGFSTLGLLDGSCSPDTTTVGTLMVAGTSLISGRP